MMAAVLSVTAASRVSGREGVLHGDVADALLLAQRVPVAPCELQVGLVGLGAAVAEEHALQTRQLCQPFSGLRLERVVIQIRRMQQRRCLLADDGGEPRVGVAERRDTDPRQQVEVFAAVGVVEA
jgi:hypothetical protein